MVARPRPCQIRPRPPSDRRHRGARWAGYRSRTTSRWTSHASLSKDRAHRRHVRSCGRRWLHASEPRTRAAADCSSSRSCPWSASDTSTRIPTPDVFEKAARGLVKELNDPYSELFTPKDVKQFESKTGGRYGGLGMLIAEDPQTHLINVETVYPNTPAEAGGVREGDKIIKVGPQSTQGWTINNVSDSLTGEPGTQRERHVRAAGSYVADQRDVHPRADSHSGGSVHDLARQRQQDRLHPAPAVQRERVRQRVGRGQEVPSRRARAESFSTCAAIRAASSSRASRSRISS